MAFMPSINNFEIEYQVNELKDFTKMGVKGAKSLALKAGRRSVPSIRAEVQEDGEDLR